jgi:hypothetical protein
MSRKYDDHDEVLDWLRDNIEQVVQYYVPDAKRRGSDMRWDGDRKSVKVAGPRRGTFRPFNETDHGLDPIGFIQWAIGKLHDEQGRKRAFDEARSVFGIGRAEGERISEEERQRIREEAERKRAERAEQERQEQEEARQWAHARFTEAERIEGWQPYLNGTRGLFLPQWPACVRFHPNCPTKPGGTEAPCILIALQGPWRTSDGAFAHNAFMAMQRIYLSDDHAHKRDWNAAKLNYGPSSGALIHLTQADHVGEDIGLCEGLENGLSLKMMVGDKLPIWAATGTSNLSNAALPPQVKRVTIFADWDEEKQRQDGTTFRPGQHAAEAARDKLLAEGRSVRIVYPNVFVPGEDWNDWIRRDQAELQRQEITEEEIEEADQTFWQDRVEATPFEEPAEPQETAGALHAADDGPPAGHPAADDGAPPPDWENMPTDPTGYREPQQGEYGHSFDIDAQKPLLNEPVAEFQSNWVWVGPLSRWFRLPDMLSLSKDQFDDWFRSRQLMSAQGRIVQASNALLSYPGTLKLEGLSYWPGKQRFVVDEIAGHRRLCLNTWQTFEIAAQEGDCQPWVDLMNHIFDGKQELVRRFEQWLAFLVQHPGAKINWAPVLIGHPGIGKTTVGDVMRLMLGSSNVRIVEQDELESQYNSYVADKQLVIFEELDRVPQKSMGILRNLITSDQITIREKWDKPVTMANRTNAMFLANDPEPLKIQPEDRRFMVHASRARQDKELAGRFWGWIKGERITREDGQPGWSYSGVAKLKSRLEQYDLSDLDPRDNAPETDSKAELQASSLSDAAHALLIMEEWDQETVRPDVVQASLVQQEMASLAKHNGIAPQSKISANWVTHGMKELGWERLYRDVRVVDETNRRKKVTLWVRRNHNLWRDRSPQQCYDHMREYMANANRRQADLAWNMDSANRPF